MAAKFIRCVAWGFCISACGLAALIAITGLQAATSAIQECSVSAVALTVAIIPYCVARAVHGMMEE